MGNMWAIKEGARWSNEILISIQRVLTVVIGMLMSCTGSKKSILFVAIDLFSRFIMASIGGGAGQLQSTDIAAIAVQINFNL
jgi:hypothetical protein